MNNFTAKVFLVALIVAIKYKNYPSGIMESASRILYYATHSGILNDSILQCVKNTIASIEKRYERDSVVVDEWHPACSYYYKADNGVCDLFDKRRALMKTHPSYKQRTTHWKTRHFFYIEKQPDYIRKEDI